MNDDHPAKKDHLSSLENNGWAISHVLESVNSPTYSYITGLNKKFKHPDIVISGLPIETAQHILIRIVERIEDGDKYSDNDKSLDIFQHGFPVLFRTVPTSWGEAQFYAMSEYYSRLIDPPIADYDILQCIVPREDKTFQTISSDSQKLYLHEPTQAEWDQI